MQIKLESVEEQLRRWLVLQAFPDLALANGDEVAMQARKFVED